MLAPSRSPKRFDSRRTVQERPLRDQSDASGKLKATMPLVVTSATISQKPLAPSPPAEPPAGPQKASIMQQPRAVWAVLVASVVAFMGIGLVDPILPIIGKGLNATPSQIELLFTSYFLIIGVSNLPAGFVSSRIRGK